MEAPRTPTTAAPTAPAAPRVVAPALPASLAPFADPSRVRADYPLLLAPAPAPAWRTLADALADLAQGAPAILQDNLARLELTVREDLSDRAAAADAAGVLAGAGERMATALDLNDGADAELRRAIEALCGRVPAGALLLPHGPDADLELLAHAARAHRQALGWRETLARQARELGRILEADAARDAEPERLASDLGSMGAAYLDAAALSKALGPARGSQRLSPARKQRLENALERIKGAATAEGVPPLVVVGPATGPADARAVPSEAPLQAAIQVFDALARAHASVCEATRVAELELAGTYEPDRHDSAREDFDWSALSLDELALLPAVVAVVDEAHLSGAGMAELIELVRSGRPIHVLVRVQAARNPGAAAATPLAGFRVELGQVGMALRQAFVQQSTPARPAHLYGGCVTAMARPRPALSVVCTGYLPDGTAPAVGAWLAAGAAIEARAHTLFHYDPDAGESWAVQLDAGDNPEPEADWVSHGEGEAARAFTFADYALLDPALSKHYAPVPALREIHEPMVRWLERDEVSSHRHIPVVPAVGSTGAGWLAVDRALALACRDRRGAWRGLRELAGFANAHARAAAQKARQEAEAEATAARAALEAAHAEALAQATAGAAGAALERLASALLATSPASLLDAPRSAPPAPAATVPAAKAAPEAAPVAEAAPAAAAAPAPEEEDEAPGDPWIESYLCTSCNDCINLNPLLFVYDNNKQATIGDPDAGTFAQLVTAAEKCPSKCIHPGGPRNPGESGVADLVARAAPYQ